MIVQSIACGCIGHVPFLNRWQALAEWMEKRWPLGPARSSGAPRSITPLELLSTAATRAAIMVGPATNHRRCAGAVLWRVSGDRTAHVQSVGYDALRRCAQRAQDLDLALSIRRAVGMQDVMEPDRRLGKDVWTLPGVPREVRLGLAVDEAPVDHAHVHSLADRQNTVKGGARAPRHVLRTENRSSIGLELPDALEECFRPVVVVKGDDVGVGELGLLHGIQVRRMT